MIGVGEELLQWSAERAAFTVQWTIEEAEREAWSTSLALNGVTGWQGPPFGERAAVRETEESGGQVGVERDVEVQESSRCLSSDTEVGEAGPQRWSPSQSVEGGDSLRAARGEVGGLATANSSEKTASSAEKTTVVGLKGSDRKSAAGTHYVQVTSRRACPLDDLDQKRTAWHALRWGRK